MAEHKIYAEKKEDLGIEAEKKMPKKLKKQIELELLLNQRAGNLTAGRQRQIWAEKFKQEK